MIWINNLTTQCAMDTHMLAVCEYDRLIIFSQDHMICGWREDKRR